MITLVFTSPMIHEDEGSPLNILPHWTADSFRARQEDDDGYGGANEEEEACQESFGG